MLWLLAALCVAGCHGKYTRPVSDDPIAPEPARLQRGSYLVNNVLFCGACHTSREHGNTLIEPERTDAYLGGGNVYNDKAIGVVWVPNITPDVETGIGAWKDDEILRVLRDGVAKDGHFLLPLMPFAAYQHLSDEDARAVVAYMRTVPAYRQTKPRQDNKLGFMNKLLFGMIGVQMHKPVARVAEPDRTNKHDYGRYLMRIAACGDCHSLTEKGPRPETDPLAFAGSDVPFEDPGLGKVYASNISGDPETGLGRYTPDAIKQALRNGTRLDGKRLAPPMSILIPHLSGMTDEDLDALVGYLKYLPAAKRKPPERELGPALRAQLGS
ncbi:MAG TPA: c-type cytochrome [Polyangia bacterium]|nr:c-type cytochrome [Polyangia bacterium]